MRATPQPRITSVLWKLFGASAVFGTLLESLCSEDRAFVKRKSALLVALGGVTREH